MEGYRTARTAARHDDSRKADKPSCDKKELLARVVKIMRERRSSIGKTRDLLDALGKGSWGKYPNQLRKCLQGIEDDLLQHGIRLDLSNAKLIVMGGRALNTH